MNSYEAKQAARRARLESAADRAQEKSDQHLDAARAALDGIPPGQPILVGHHSERRHRAALSRHDRNMRRGIDAQEQARDLARRAAAVGSGGISSDDPDAVAKLRQELSKLEDEQLLMRAVNEAHRRFLRDPASLEAAPLSESIKDKIRTYKPAYSWEPHPIAPYQLQNAGANIRRIKARIEELKRKHRRASEPSRATLCVGFEVIENFAKNRLQLKFPGKPSSAVRDLLKRNGFHWCRSEGAWQRMLNGGIVLLVTQGYLRKELEELLVPRAVGNVDSD